MDKKVEIEQIYSLSPMQEGMLFHWLMKDLPGTDAYYRQSVFKVKGNPDIRLFEKSINHLIDRYEVLRTVFVYDKIKKPKQVVLKKVEFRLSFEDLSCLSQDRQCRHLEDFKQEDRYTGFDLTKGLAMRITLFKTAEATYTLVWSYHHIIMDGWCLGILFGDLVRIYQGLVKGGPLEMDPVVPYRHYIKWLEARDREVGLGYWREYLAGYEHRASLPRLAKGAGKTGYRLEEYPLVIPGEQADLMMKMAVENQVTVNTLCRALWGILLQRYNNTQDVVFGAIVSGRPAEIPGIESMVGLFINAVPVRVRVGGGQHFSRLITGMQQGAVSSMAHEYLPLAEVQALSPLKGNLLDHLMVFENYPLEENLQKGGKKGDIGFSVEGFEAFTQTDYDFNILIARGSTLSITFNFNGAVYDTGFIKEVARHFINLVHQVVENPGITVESLCPVTDEEKRQLLYEFNDTYAPYPEDRNLHELFEERAAKMGDRAAVIGRVALSYSELNKKSDQAAYLMRKRGVLADSIVGIMVERSIEMIVGILGILKAGGAYLPIDPDYPRERIDYMMSDSGALILLAAEDEIFNNIYMSYTSYTSNMPAVLGIGPPRRGAYVIYTSGSTGKPKGVMVEHTSAVNILYCLERLYPIGEADSYLLKTNFTFDVSVTELFGWFFGKGRLAILEKEAEKDPWEILTAIEKQRITHINFVPSMFSVFMEILNPENAVKLSALKYIFLAGEALLPGLVERFEKLNTGTALENIYGPTEGTVYSSRYSLSHWQGGDVVPIGKPLQNTGLYILDKYNRLQPVGLPGELCISGTGLARGYLNNPELTASRFCLRRPGGLILKKPPPWTPRKNFYLTRQKFCGGPGGGFSKEPPGRRRQYHTGDLVRWLVDGNIEFLGRMDQQVKVRGFRIELGEIESRLMRHEGIEGAVVVMDGPGSLCAYIVPAPGRGEVAAAGLKQYLSRSLPYYMIPSYFVHLEKIPLTTSGKLDRRSLPAHRIAPGKNYTAPTNEMEEKLALLWSEVLMTGETPIGIDDHFFELGGHSLKVTLLAARIHKELDIKVPVSEVFERPTIRKLAAFLAKTGKEEFSAIEAVELKEYYPLSSAQKRLFVLSKLEGIGTAYNMPLAVGIEGRVDKGHFQETFRALIRRHESLGTSFHLIGDHPVQKIRKEVEFVIEYYDLATDEHGLERTHHSSFSIHHFDLTRSPLLRVGLVRLEEEKYKMLLDMHHIISDGISLAILVQEFAVFYAGGAPAPLRIQYKDYSCWQEKLFASEDFTRQERYWLQEEFSGEIPVLNMPLDFQRPGKLTFEGHVVKGNIPAAAAGKLMVLARSQDVTLNILFFALYAVLLSKYSRQQEIVIGSLSAGRSHTHLEKVVGMFANFLPVKIKIQGQQGFKGILKGVKSSLLKAYENQDYPFEKIVGHLEERTDLSRNPLFDTMLMFHDEFDGTVDAGVNANRHAEIRGLKFTYEPLEESTSTLDFKLDIYPAGPAGEFDLYLEYNTNLFKEETMTRLLHHLNTLAEEVAVNPDLEPAKVELFTREEQARMEEKGTSLKLVVSATFTADPIKNYVQWWSKKFHLDAAPEFPSYNQVFQDLIGENSPVSLNHGVNLILIRFEDWLRDSPPDSDEQKIAALENHFAQLTRIVKEKKKAAPYFFGIFPVSTHLSLSPALVNHLEQMNRRWQKILEEMENVYVVDFKEVIQLYGIEEVFDAVKDREGHLPFSDEYYAAVGTMVARKLVALKKPPYKVIVLDCDNTLWQGICGEDGAEGVRIEGPYRELQRFMLEKLDQGMLLALCSKNNEADVWEVFEKNPQMLLKKEHLVGWRINWNPKSGGLEELAAELNLGIDSFIFVDDSPMECSQVMDQCPNVLTLQLPEDPQEIPMFLKHIWAFDRLKVTAEDRNRTRMYLTERKRREVGSRITSLEDFIKNLELKIKMKPIDSTTLPRAAQLTQRTNQFNLSTLRRSETELGELLRSPGIMGWILQVGDRFGDYGLVGVVIAKEEAGHLFIDTFLLSCRVLGRRVENAILAGLKKYCLSVPASNSSPEATKLAKSFCGGPGGGFLEMSPLAVGDKNLSALHAKFIPTKKNKPFLEFIEKSRWEKIEESADHTVYMLRLDDIPEVPAYIDFEFTMGQVAAAADETAVLLEKLEKVNELYLIPHRFNLENTSDYGPFFAKLMAALSGYAKIHNDTPAYIVEAYDKYYRGFLKLQEEFKKTGGYRFASYAELENALEPAFYKDYIYILLLSYITTYYRFEMKQFIDDAFQKYLAKGKETGLEVGFGTGIDLVERLKYFQRYDLFDSNRYSKDMFHLLFPGSGKISFHDTFFKFNGKDKYSCVQLIELLEHLEGPVSYLEGAFNVLKPGGFLIFTAAVNMANIDHIYLFRSYRDVEAAIDPGKWQVMDKTYYINSLFKYSQAEGKDIIENDIVPYIAAYILRKKVM